MNEEDLTGTFFLEFIKKISLNQKSVINELIVVDAYVRI